ncbi:MAG: Hsp20/alpha crystallin family protein [Pseudobdellovibrionaceae bacterium]
MFIRELNDFFFNDTATTEIYTEKAKDPFFKVQNRGTTLSETDNMYVVRAYVPESDKDNVKVRIQNDKVVVAGSRAFVDKLEDQGKKVSTNSYQTFKEEFKLDHPVAQNAIWQERDGDFLQFLIPKIGFVNKKV